MKKKIIVLIVAALLVGGGCFVATIYDNCRQISTRSTINGSFLWVPDSLGVVVCSFFYIALYTLGQM